MKKNTEYEQLIQDRIRQNTIIRSMEDSNEQGTAYKYDEEQMIEAQSESAKKEINNLYSNKINPSSNGILYLVYYLFSLIAVPLLYCNVFEKYIVIGAWFLFIVIVIVLKVCEKMYQKEMQKQSKIVDIINDFSNESFVFCYVLTSLGYMLDYFDNLSFWTIYLGMLMATIIIFYYRVIKPLLRIEKQN